MYIQEDSDEEVANDAVIQPVMDDKDKDGDLDTWAISWFTIHVLSYRFRALENKLYELYVMFLISFFGCFSAPFSFVVSKQTLYE